ncbi:MAG: flippase [Proteobacteria bacterium]|nr:flippase [Pseudomonadota bacterium]MBU1738865.1 flippase [Pseudomonadota bacterium]
MKADGRKVGITNQSLSKRITANFVWSILSEATAKGVFFVTNIYLARSLGVSGFGVFALAQTITYYFWFAVNLGVDMYGIREIARNRTDSSRIINPLFTLRVTSGAVFFLIYAASVALVDMPPEHRVAFIGCGFYLFTQSLYSDWVFKGIEKFKYIAYGSFASSGIFLIAVFFLVRGENDLGRAAFAWSAAGLFGSIILLYILPGKTGITIKPDFNFRVWSSHIRESIYLSISSALLTVYRYLSVLLISFFFTPFEVGIFMAPYRAILAVGTAGVMLPMAFYPALSEMYIRDRMGFRKTQTNLHWIMCAMGIPFAGVGMFFGEEIVLALFGSSYEASVLAFRLLVWLIPLFFLRHSYGFVLIAAGHQRLHNIAVLAGVVCMAVTGIILIPMYSVIGGALALLFSELSILVAIVIFVIKRVWKGSQESFATNEASDTE